MRTFMNLSYGQLVCMLLGGLAVVGNGCAASRQAALVAALPAMEAAKEKLPLTHSANEIRGQVVDGETGQPVAGVAVVATWQMTVIVGLQYASQRLHIVEGITDATGSYVIPGWGPKLLPLGAEVSRRTPTLHIFKSGYRPKIVANSDIGRRFAVPDSDWYGKAIPLEHPTGTIEQQAANLSTAYSVLTPGYPEKDPQDWKNFPKATLEAYKEMRRLQALGLPRWLGLLSVFDVERLDKTDREFLRRFE